MYPIEKYQFHTDGVRRVIAVSTYAGQTVRGVAVCHEDDGFDLEKGKKIAAARCAVKVAQKRVNRANQKYDEAFIAVQQAHNYLNKIVNYVQDADLELEEAWKNLNDTIHNNTVLSKT